MRRSVSLRVRLTGIILLPILFVAALAGAWQLANARSTAAEVFDRSLLSAALAVARDVAVSGGDALSERTRDILADTSGGTVFYHVYAPDGVIVAGYATPPVGVAQGDPGETEPRYFDASYLGRDVRGVRIQMQTQIDGFSGVFTTTVWQDRDVRQAFVRELMLQPMIGTVGIILALALIVWFGVRLGLRPLLELEKAIEVRSSEELSPIRRSVPMEVEGVVSTLNRLFHQVSQSMAAQAEFISNAAHQLRNPIAGVLSLAEAVNRAKSLEDVKKRSRDLLNAAKEAAELSQKLLLLERAKAISPASAFEFIDVADLVRDLAAEFTAAVPSRISFKVEADRGLGKIRGDRTMLLEAARNLFDNALRHGGQELTKISLVAQKSGGWVSVSISDNGAGLMPDQIETAKMRFVGLSGSSGSGLGVSIADTVALAHGGTLELSSANAGLVATLYLPTEEI